MVTDEFTTFLVSVGLAAGENVDVIYVDKVDAPDTVLIIEPFSGPPPIHNPDTATYRIEQPAVAITVRDAKDRHAAYVRAEAILRALDSISNRDINGVRYLSVRASHSAPISLPNDEHDRPAWSLNFNVMKYPSPLP